MLTNALRIVLCRAARDIDAVIARVHLYEHMQHELRV